MQSMNSHFLYIRDGNSSWQTITLNSVLGKFWVNGAGMTVRPATYSEPSYGLNMSIDCKAASGYSIPDSQRIQYLSRYLAEHPEGIALWLKKDNSHMHSVIVTKEENGVFYCYDPAFTTGNLQRLVDVKNYQDFDTSRRLTQSELLNNYFFQFWYITSSQNSADKKPLPTELPGPWNMGDEFYAYVKHAGSERHLAVNLGNVRVTYIGDIWHFTRNNDGSYTIEYRRDGRYLNAEADGNSDWTNVNVTESKGANTQKWYIYGSDGNYVFMPKSSDCRVLDIENGDTSDGANIQIFSYNLTSSQKFCIEKTTKHLVSNIQLDPEYMNLKVGETKQLILEITPETAFDCFISKYSRNPEVATISKTGKVTAKKEGTTRIVVTAEGWGFTTCLVTVGNGENVTLPTPTISKIVAIVSGTHIYWNKISDADSYTIYRANAKNGTYTKIASTTATHYIDTGVTSGNNYFYKICANAGKNKSEDSIGKGIVFVGTPDFTLRVNRSTGIGLGWNKISGATGYAVYRKSYNGNDPWVRVATITSGNTVSWTDTSVKSKNGSIYRYTVRALAGSDRKTLSGCRNTGRTMVRLMTPVLNSVSSASATSMKAAWGKNSQASGYEVRLMVGGTVYKTYIVGGNANLTKTITGLKKGTTYKVQVRAYKKVDGVGSFYSAWSGAKNVVMK